jgi:glycosyltransferase involved in cell wall biosynthesis
MPKIAIVHDYFIQMGGAEKVAEELQVIFPSATMFSTVDLRGESAIGKRKSSWLQKLPINKKNHRYFFLFYPFAVESLDLTEFDIIISSSSSYAKGVKKRKDAIHICYCHTPMRWVWSYENYAEREDFGKFSRFVLPIVLSALKRWDLRAAKKPDYFVANSKTIAKRIKECYGRESIVIPPPIDVQRFSIDEQDDDYYLILSRLVPYKKLDLAVKAFKKLNRQLIVIGEGTDRNRLESMAGENTTFLGRQPDSVVNQIAARCRALIFPGEEDFGMTPLEINAAGRPVIAYNAGGALETVIDNETGVFFKEQTTESLVEAIERFETLVWDKNRLRDHAARFDRSVFAERITNYLQEVIPESIGFGLERKELKRQFGLQQSAT